MLREITLLLETIQKTLFDKAQERRSLMHQKSDDLTLFGPLLEEQGSFYQTSWCGQSACEAELKKYTASIRCIIEGISFPTCFHCKTSSKHDVLVARSY